MKSLLVVIAITLSFRLMYAAARRQRPISGQENLVFPAATAFKALLWAGLCFWALLACLPAFVLSARTPWWAELIFVVFLFLTPFGFPPLLTIAPDGLTSRYWYGRSTTFLWNEVAQLEYYPAASATKVVAANGRKIWHSGFHVGSGQFRDKVQKRTQLPISIRTPSFIGSKTTEIRYPDGRVANPTSGKAMGA